MKTRIVFTLAALALCTPVHAIKKAAPCPANATQLIGAWTSEKSGSFEQFELAKEDGAHVFRSWLHDRPEITDARWTYRACQLQIITRDKALGTSFTVVLVSLKRLVLMERGDKARQVYRRIIG